MAMRFTIDHEKAYRARRDELVEQFAGWLDRNLVPGDPGDAELLLDWRFAYGDGRLDRWSVTDLSEFLLGWCPRTLLSPEELWAGIPQSVAAFMQFLGDRRILAPDNENPAVLSRHCEQVTGEFVAAMRGAAASGTAEERLAGGDAALPAETLAELERLTGMDSEELLEMLVSGTGPGVVGPVRIPSEAEQLASVRAAPVTRQIRDLAAACAAPGLPLTAKGNLRIADARRLVDELGTGDEPDSPYGKLRSSAELPALSWLVDVAVTVRAVRRHRGRLVAVARFAQRDELDAYRAVVEAAFDVGLIDPYVHYFPGLVPVHDFIEAGAPRLLAELLDAHGAGEGPVPVAALAGLVEEVVAVAFTGVDEFTRGWIAYRVLDQVQKLVRLGVLAVVGSGDTAGGIESETEGEIEGTTTADATATGEDADPRLDVFPDPHDEVARAGAVALTPAGVAVAVDAVRELGYEVVLRPDPLTAQPGELVDALVMLDREAAEADLTTWFGARPDPAAAAARVVAEITAERRAPIDVVGALDLAGRVLGEHAADAVRARQGGPHDDLVTGWLLSHGHLDPETAGRDRVLASVVGVAAVVLDEEGPEGMLEFVSSGDRAHSVEMLDHLWRLDHPRVADVLEVIGGHHPDNKIAKAGRKALMQHRSRS
ncbi:MAG TPA: hypothetical protein VD813_01840 [Pseudonocardia sp.]|nr:hypothetical protein [Pseudonocardia sp.]